MKETKPELRGLRTLLLDVPCTFGRPTIGPTVPLRVTIAKHAIPPNTAAELINSACEARLRADPLSAEDAAGQQTAVDTGAELTGLTVNVGSVTGTHEHWSFSLTIEREALSDEGVLLLCDFSGLPGNISLTKVGDAAERRGRPKKESGDDGEEAE